MNIEKYGKRIHRQMKYGRVLPNCLSEASLALAYYMLSRDADDLGREIKLQPSVLIIPPSLRDIAESVVKDSLYYPPEGCVTEFPGLNRSVTSYP